jgi:predicted ATPase
MNFSKSIKESVVVAVLSMTNFLGRYDENIVDFVNRIWPLREMKSTDDRYKDAYGDFVQHLVNNSDWDFNFTFLERLKILEAEEDYFVRFIEFIVSPEVRVDKEDILSYVSVINTTLSVSDYRLVLTDYFEALPVFKLQEKSKAKDLPPDIAKNQIPFYKNSDTPPLQRPYFRLSYDNWDDYTYKTLMDLSFQSEESPETLFIGRVKILKKGAAGGPTWDSLDDTFSLLPTDFCSLGQSQEYYERLKELLGNQYQSVLYALRDAAFFPRIQEEFENEEGFRKSLLRSNSVEQLMRSIRFKLNGIDLATRFIFTFQFTPPYSSDRLNLNFNFRYSGEFQHRVYALIGKNGTGKTRLLASLAKNLSERSSSAIRPHRPLFGKVFTVSYSYFDRFDIPEGNAEFNYVYCGLKKPDGTWMSDDDLMARFLETAQKIIAKDRVNEWYQTLNDFIPNDLLDIIFRRESKSFQTTLAFVQESVGLFSVKLSSGQNILMFIISEILAQIRFNSLILYDEPETHLHPNAISSLMFTVFNLVKRFESFCIIATHSPIVIQEIPSRNIFIIERNKDQAEVRRLQMESFGENLTVITDEIFGNRPIAKHQYMVLEELVKDGRSYEEILEIIKSDNLPVPLNTRLFLQSILPKVQ